MLRIREAEIQRNWLKEKGISDYELATQKDIQARLRGYYEQNDELKYILSEISLKEQRIEELELPLVIFLTWAKVKRWS